MSAGQTIFWTATAIAAVIIAAEAWSYVHNIEEGYPVLPIFPLIVAVGIWLLGWAFRSRS